VVCTKEEFSGNLRARMAKINMTQGELAESSGIPVGTIGLYFRGESMPSADRVVTMAQTLGTDPNTLLGWGQE